MKWFLEIDQMFAFCWLSHVTANPKYSCITWIESRYLNKQGFSSNEQFLRGYQIMTFHICRGSLWTWWFKCWRQEQGLKRTEENCIQKLKSQANLTLFASQLGQRNVIKQSEIRVMWTKHSAAFSFENWVHWIRNETALITNSFAQNDSQLSSQRSFSSVLLKDYCRTTFLRSSMTAVPKTYWKSSMEIANCFVVNVSVYPGRGASRTSERASTFKLLTTLLRQTNDQQGLTRKAQFYYFIAYHLRRSERTW